MQAEHGVFTLKIKNPVNYRIFYFYCISGAIAATGHIAAHVPHDIHFCGSITHLPSGPVLIAHTGHAPIHVWHPIHFCGSILYAIFLLLCNCFLIAVKQA